MGGPEPGRYFIELVASKQIIGVDPYGSPIPIITDGGDDIWQVDKLEDGTYILTLVKGDSFYVQNGGGAPVASPEPPASAWRIEGPDGGPYTIQLPGNRLPPSAWTVRRPGLSKTFVNLFPLELQFPHENQEWNFIPVLE